MANHSTPAKNDDPWLSLLIPMYNVECYLDECVQSILKQSVSNIEIIIVDDCSTDGSFAAAAKLRDVYPETISLIQLARNSGVSAVRNALLDAARGEYLWYVDPDDFLFPGSLEGLQQIIEAMQPDIISCNYQKDTKRKNAYRGQSEIVERNRATFVSGVLSSRKLYCWTKIIRRSIWPSALRFPDGRYFEDVATIPPLLLNAKSFYHSKAIWVHYRTRNDSILSSIRSNSDFDVNKNWDLAIALDGYSAAIDVNVPAGTDREKIRYSASHFIACEFAKITLRIWRTKKSGADRSSLSALIHRFWQHMNHSSPMRFAELLTAYRKRGNLGRYAVLRFCCFLAQRDKNSDVQA